MAVIILLHLDRVVRERIESALKGKGLTVRAAGEVEQALGLADGVDVSAVLVDPRVLLRESYDIGARFEVRAGKPVRVIALTHVAGAAEAQAFQRHGASLLIAPLDDLNLLALYLGTGQSMPDEVPRGDSLLPAEKDPDTTLTAVPGAPASEGTIRQPHKTQISARPAISNAPPGWDTPRPIEDTVPRIPGVTADPSVEEAITPEMEAALERARAEVARIRRDHAASRAAADGKVAASRAARDEEMRYQPPADPREELAAIAAPPSPDGTPPRVLVIEDDLGCRDFFQDVLAARGYRVHSCASVPAALRYLQRGNPVDLILSDINMPIFDGFEMKWMLDHEARLAGFGAIPFLAVSAEDTAEKYSLALRLGAVAMIPKPVKNLRGFCKLVRSTLERVRDDKPAAPA